MKTSVVIGRYQIDELHEGHLKVLEQANKEGDLLVILVGVPAVSFTNTNPLTFSMRRSMLSKAFPKAIVLPINDHRSDVIWSENVDEILTPFQNVTLYGGRNSFKSSYYGKHKVKSLNFNIDVSATDRRKAIGELRFHANPEYRKGVIHVTQRKFPTAYPTVDIGLIRMNYKEGCTEILLGKKRGRDKYCLPGGFVDPSDLSLEAAARRELSEEVPGVTASELTYVSSHKINDFRYRGTQDGIMTTLFYTHFISGIARAGDDLAEVKWFPLNRDVARIVSDSHIPLIASLLNRRK